MRNNLLQKTDDTGNQHYTWDNFSIVSSSDKAGTNFYVQDELGSPIRYMDDAGKLVDTYGYDVFGENLYNHDKHQPFGFAGYQYDETAQTYFAQAREYQSGFGRFISQDVHWDPLNMIYGDNPVKWNEKNANLNTLPGHDPYKYVPDITAIMQSGNLYMYCMNNPILYKDDTGDFIGTILGAVGGFFIGGITSAINGDGFWKGATSGALSGATTGAIVDLSVVTGGFGLGLAPVAASTLGSLAGGTIGGGVGNISDQLWDGATWNTLDWDSIGRSAAIGGAFGLIGSKMSGIVGEAFNIPDPHGATIFEKLFNMVKDAKPGQVFVDLWNDTTIFSLLSFGTEMIFDELTSSNQTLSES